MMYRYSLGGSTASIFMVEDKDLAESYHDCINYILSIGTCPKDGCNRLFRNIGIRIPNNTPSQSTVRFKSYLVGSLSMFVLKRSDI